MAEVIVGLTTLSLGDVDHFFSIEPGVQEGPVGTLHPKAPLKFNKGEVVVDSSLPLQPASQESRVNK